MDSIKGVNKYSGYDSKKGRVRTLVNRFGMTQTLVDQSDDGEWVWGQSTNPYWVENKR